MATSTRVISTGPSGVRMEDVAREAGVSLVTVSRAINLPTKVAPRTLAEVRAAIERLGYVPNLTAGSLASNRSQIVAAVVPTISNLVFSETIDSLARTLADGGYQLLLGQSLYRPREELALVNAFLGRRVDGLFLTGCSQDAALIARLRRSNIPVVQTWDLPSGPEDSTLVDMAVGFSNAAAGRLAARHLLSRGRRALGFIGAEEQRSRQRLEGFREEAAAAGVPDVAAELIRPPVRVDQAAARLAQLLARRPGLDAVFCNNDLLAAGVLFECQRRGLAVPGQLAVIGFGDMSIAEAAFPKLTTVRVHRGEMGERAGQLLLARLANKDPGETRIDIGFELVERAST